MTAAPCDCGTTLHAATCANRLSAPERPLHVRVAEALGWDNCVEVDTGMAYGKRWTGRVPGFTHTREVPRYGQDSDEGWAATGRLIQKYGINLERAQAARPDGSPYGAWRWAIAGDEMPPKRFWADTPLEAVCHLILALAEAGRLPK